MTVCPRCHQTVAAEAVTCPHCRVTLKAFGHPGIPLYRSEGEEYLCDRCTYHFDDSCTFPQRPYAKSCTLFQDYQQVRAEPEYQLPPGAMIKGWLRRNRGLLLLLGLIALSLILALT
ncbi:MAG: hypothetical protein HC890_05460 [Chloroflexaceae bacterium]|nr:hypothetical protein [Chloroflexaceae bacterium]